MRLLYDNRLGEATLSMTTQNDSFPVGNLVEREIGLVAKSTISSTTITATWGVNQTVSCIALSNTNATTATFALYDSTDTLLDSGSLEIEYLHNITHFDEYATVRKLEIYIENSAEVYLGGASCGDCLHFDFHNVNPRMDFPSESSVSWLLGGHSLGVKGSSLRQWRATLSDISLSQKARLEDMFSLVDTVYPIYADLYEALHDTQEPLYCIYQGDKQLTRDSKANTWSHTIVVKETY